MEEIVGLIICFHVGFQAVMMYFLNKKVTERYYLWEQRLNKEG
jgi:hypothetical protein